MAPTRADQDNVLHGPPASYPPLAYNLGQVYLECMDKNSEKIALIDPVRNITLTHGEVKKRSIRVALEMKARGVTKGDFLTICGKNRINLNLSFLAGLYLGTTINPLHPSFSQNEFKIMLDKTQPKMILCDESCYEEMTSVIKALNLKTELISFEKDFEPFLGPHAGEDTFVVETVDPAEAIAFVVCSSGTTGLVKGVTITHKCFYVTLIEFKDITQPGDVMLLYSPLSWISALWIFGISIQNGLPRIIAEYDPDENIEIMTKYKVTWALFTPQKFTEIIHHRLFAKSDIATTLKTILFGGSAATHDQIKEYWRVFPHANLSHGYGSSEMCSPHAMFDRTKFEVTEKNMYSVGTLQPTVTAKIIDLETKESLGRNQSGEIVLKGAAMTKRYYKDPEATANAFDKDGWFHSGDIGYFDDDGFLYMVGRSKELLKYKGWQVTPIEIENVLDYHPDVKKSCVIGLPHKTDGDLALAFVQKNPGSTITEEELVNYVNDRVVDLQKLRGGVRFIDEIPMTASGKMRRMDLKKLLPIS